MKRLAMFLLFMLVVTSPLMAKRKLTLQAYPSKVKMVAGTSLRFTAIARDYEGMATTPSGLIWMASGGTINRNGNFTAPKRAGVYKIKVAFGKQVDEARVTVVAPKEIKSKKRKIER